MNFEAMSDNLRGLLTATRVYKIPRFQREFSWDTSNYNEFLEDMLTQIKFNEENETFSNQKYFLGNMLFLGNKEDSKVEVIDGQQRLTTATILLAAIRNSLYEYEQENPTKEEGKSAKEYANTIQTEYLIKRIDGEPQRKLKTATSYPYFTQTIQDYNTKNDKVEPSTEEEELLFSTFENFLANLKKDALLTKLNKIHNVKIKDQFYVFALKALRDQILTSEIIDVFVNEKDQANKIFENINSKGKPLSQVDLIKNTIFGRIGLTEAGVDEIEDTWSLLKKELANLDTTFNEFFLHYWKAVYPLDKANGKNLYKKFNAKFAKKKDSELIQFVEELEKGLKIYKKIISPDRNEFTRMEHKEELECLLSINKFKAVQIRPSLLAFYLKNEKKTFKLRQSEKSEFLRFICDFHFSAFGTSLNLRSNKTTNPYNNFVKKLSKANNKMDVRKACSDMRKDLIKLIPKEELISAFKNLEFSKKTARTGIDAFPASYAIKRLSDIKNKRKYNDMDYSIEHIIDESDGDVNNIGNLLVLEQMLNKEIDEQKKKKKRTLNFSEKKKIYSKSKYDCVRVFCTETSSFEKTDIEKRATILAEEFWGILDSATK
ncbi:DUF262 domain-containing protein [Exiguobacterium sp. MH3]|uniref:DUF262 domain-containing protein n=1 Tax=Exiguobacterium sp. MH3 TaxID=1399115 RepID=UPI0003C3F8C0|nr:DUF262 domain-containing protein [Exiguobacterium sp. MH3]AHA31502.1 hypothetical protein U719_13070 [Exiguobacterium sp. MH3]